MTDNTPTFREILRKLEEASSVEPKDRLDELFGGLGNKIGSAVSGAAGAVKSKIANRQITPQAKNVVASWGKYAATTGGRAKPNRSGIEMWVKKQLGVVNPSIWDMTYETLKNENPPLYNKYMNPALPVLSSSEMVNFFTILIAERNMTLTPNKDADPDQPQQQQQQPTTGQEQKPTGPMNHPARPIMQPQPQRGQRTAAQQPPQQNQAQR